MDLETLKRETAQAFAGVDLLMAAARAAIAEEEDVCKGELLRLPAARCERLVARWGTAAHRQLMSLAVLGLEAALREAEQRLARLQGQVAAMPPGPLAPAPKPQREPL